MKIAHAILVLVFFSVACSATYITLTTTTETEKTAMGGSTWVNVSIINKGDEPAYDVVLSLVVPEGFEANEIPVGALEPEKPYVGQFIVKLPETRVGSYHLVMVTHYKDVNGYPFSTLAPVMINYRVHTSSKLYGSMETLNVSKGAKSLKLTVRNFDEKPHQVNAKLFLPDELTVDVKEKQIQLNAHEEKPVSFEVSNFGALPNSNYAVFASLEYDDELHYSALASGLIRVVESADDTNEDWLTSPVFLGLGMMLLLLVAIFVYLKFVKR